MRPTDTKICIAEKIGITIVTIVVLHFITAYDNSGTDVHIIVESF